MDLAARAIESDGSQPRLNDDTLLQRQVHPDFVQDDQVTSQAFTPMIDKAKPVDDQKRTLSVYDGDQISPVASWSHYTQELGRESVGVVGVLVRECAERGLGVFADGVPYKEHAYIDFEVVPDLTGNKIQKLAKRLAVLARKHEWLHRSTL